MLGNKKIALFILIHVVSGLLNNSNRYNVWFNISKCWKLTLKLNDLEVLNYLTNVNKWNLTKE